MVAVFIVGGILLFGGGIATGVSLNKQKTHKIIEEQTQMIGAIQDGQRELLEAASKPVVLDAELKASLAQVPVQCIESAGGDAMSVQCAWASCAAYGQSSANRPECSKLTELLVRTLGFTAEEIQYRD